MFKLYQNLPAVEEPVTGNVVGTIPPWIKGSLYRNGPTMYEIGGERFSHLFDGMACIQKFQIENGSATYMRKYVNSETFKKNTSVNKIVVSEFGTLAKYPDPCKTIFGRFMAHFSPTNTTDNTCVTVWPMRDRLFASTETGTINEIHPENLDVIRRISTKKELTVDAAIAHWHEDGDGSKYSIGYCYGSRTNYCLFKIPSGPDSQTDFKDSKMVAKIPSRWRTYPSYYHSFAMTENYYVFLEQPLTINVIKLLPVALKKSAFGESLQFWPNEKTIFHIVDKKTGQRVNQQYTYQTQALFCFHHGNAYEHQGQIVLDFCEYNDDTIIKKLYLKYWEKDSYEEVRDEIPPARYTRYVLPLDVDQQTPQNENLVKQNSTKCTATLSSGGKITCSGEQLFEKAFEFPQINYNIFNGKMYRYVYGISNQENGVFVVKLDIETRETKEWSEDHVYCSEPIFIPNPDGQAEDDGELLSWLKDYISNREQQVFIEDSAVLVAVHSTDRQAFLLVLDGQTFQETARVTFSDVNYFVRDFHGSFMSKPE